MVRFWRAIWSALVLVSTLGVILPRVWWYALGYFGAYLPYAPIIKGLSKGWLGGSALSGFATLPLSVAAATVTTMFYFTILGKWRHATAFHLGSWRLPRPRWATFLAGVSTSGIMLTTTFAYTLRGVSVVFIMLLLRGGMLLLGPPLDWWFGRRIRWWSWVATALTIGGLFVAFLEKEGYEMSAIAALDVAVYLVGYIVRLRAMAKLGKSDDPNVSWGYFVEEQMTVTPAALLFLVAIALVGRGDIAEQIRYGFIGVWSTPMWPLLLLAGFLSQLTGMFGGLVLLEKQESSFCIPVNRASSILAGLLGETILLAWLGKPLPSKYQVVGAACVVAALLVLSIPPLLEKRWQANKRKRMPLRRLRVRRSPKVLKSRQRQKLASQARKRLRRTGK